MIPSLVRLRLPSAFRTGVRGVLEAIVNPDIRACVEVLLWAGVRVLLSLRAFTGIGVESLVVRFRTGMPVEGWDAAVSFAISRGSGY